MTLSGVLTNLANQYRNKEGFLFKLGLDDMAYLLSVNNLTTMSGVNLLRNTDPVSNSIFGQSYSTNKWITQSGGDGYPTVINLDSTFKAKHGFQINNNHGGNRDLGQIILLPNDIFTFSMKVKCATPETKNVPVIIRLFAMGNDCVFQKIFSADTYTSWQKLQVTFNSSTFYNTKQILKIQIGFNGKGSFAMAEPMLEVGNTAHDWSPCPIDKLTS